MSDEAGFSEIDEDSSSWESMDEEEDFCQKLSQNSLVLEKIFDYLPSSELLKCRLVSKLWSSTALLKNQLGCKIKIKITNDNVERFIQTSENALIPFCRQFDFHMLDLDLPKVVAFNKVFKQCLLSISMKFCNAQSPKPLLKLLHSPNLRELKITGNLPEFGQDCLAFGKHKKLHRLTHLEISSSVENGQVSQHFIRNIVQNSPSLHSVSIGHSASLWREFVDLASTVTTINSKLEEIRLISIEGPLMIVELEKVLQRLKIFRISFTDCIVGQNFLQGCLELCGNTLQRLIIQGTQHEILSRVFSEIPMKCLSHLTLPIDGVSTQDGSIILNSLPNLQNFIVVGLFRTIFVFQHGKLNIFLVESLDHVILSSSNQNFSAVIISEKRREFLKVLTLIPLESLKVSINLPELNSRCLRRVIQKYPTVQELVVKNNSRGCLDAWTGLPIKACRKLVSCKSFAVANSETLQRFSSLKEFKKLERLEISILDDPPKTEFTLLYVLYGFCQLPSLEVLKLNNFTMSDIAFLALSKMSKLKICYTDGSSRMWDKFKIASQNVKIRSFLLPPECNKHSRLSPLDPLTNVKILHKIFTFLPRTDVFELRKVSQFWHSTSKRYLHLNCTEGKYSSFELEKYLEDSKASNSSGQPSPNKTPRKILTEPQTTRLRKALNFLENEPSLTTLIFRGMNKSMLEFYQRENTFSGTRFAHSEAACEDRRKITYWFYPDGTDDLITPENLKATSITVIGSWTRKDSALLEFLSPTFSINSVVLFGLLQEVYDLILPKLTTMSNLESLSIMPFSSNSVSEITRNHLQILANSSFSLKSLSMQKLQVPQPETIAVFIRSHRYTLEILNIQNHVNVSDRLSFTIPNLKILQLDEPPGLLLWTTLNINQSLESIHFERSGYIYNQVKSKAIPKLELVDLDFEHSATEMLCDVNLFLECVANRRPGVQKSILQEGSDSALKFFNHFRFLSSLTLRSVHGHYGLLQGIFRNLKQLEKLVFTNSTGINDEIITGLPKAMLDTMDLFNPLQFKQLHSEIQGVSDVSIRHLKNLTYLAMDDQTLCSDFSVIFGILKLSRLKYFSCKKWKITDVSIRAIADMTSVSQLVTEGSTGVSKLGIEYFRSKSKIVFK